MISDAELSAFLDHALSANDMERVRQAIEQDPSLSDRLAAFATVDLLAKSHWDEINAKPLPAAVVAQLQQATANGELDNVVQFPPQTRRWPMAIAASALLTLALVSGGLMTTFDSATPTLADALDHAQSGQQLHLDDDSQIKLVFSFKAADGGYCRHYVQQQGNHEDAVVACKKQGEWSTVASIANTATTQSYQTATAKHPLDDVLDTMMLSGPLSSDEEQHQIQLQWPQEQ